MTADDRMDRNWAGNIVFGSRRRRRPETVEELAELVATSTRMRVLGSGHSFNDIADTTEDLVSLAGLPPTCDVGPSGVRVAGGLRYGDIVAVLHAAGFALPNLASLPHIAVAGACATGTHGSGARLGSLATSVAALELMGPDGSLTTVRRGEADFDGSVVALGALGPVVSITLDTVATFDVAQYWYNDLPFAALTGDLTAIMSAGYSVSVFTDWVTRVSVLRKEIAPSAPPPREWFGATAATHPEHPIAGLPADACTPQLGRPGPWHERLPHFRMDFTPSSGDELQSEYFVALESGPEAIAAVAGIADQLRPVLQVSEVRAVAADQLWLSPAYGRDSLAIHFTWVSDTAAVQAVLATLEQRLAPFDARPHWGKLFAVTAGRLAELYPRLPSFVDLMTRRDPGGKFRNAYLDRVIAGLPDAPARP